MVISCAQNFVIKLSIRIFAVGAVIKSLHPKIRIRSCSDNNADVVIAVNHCVGRCLKSGNGRKRQMIKSNGLVCIFKMRFVEVHPDIIFKVRSPVKSLLSGILHLAHIFFKGPFITAIQ